MSKQRILTKSRIAGADFTEGTMSSDTYQSGAMQWSCHAVIEDSVIHFAAAENHTAFQWAGQLPKLAHSSSSYYV